MRPGSRSKRLESRCFSPNRDGNFPNWCRATWTGIAARNTSSAWHPVIPFLAVTLTNCDRAELLPGARLVVHVGPLQPDRQRPANPVWVERHIQRGSKAGAPVANDRDCRHWTIHRAMRVRRRHRPAIAEPDIGRVQRVTCVIGQPSGTEAVDMHQARVCDYGGAGRRRAGILNKDHARLNEWLASRARPVELKRLGNSRGDYPRVGRDRYARG